MRRYSVFLVLPILLGIARDLEIAKGSLSNQCASGRRHTHVCGKDMIVTVRDLTLKACAVGSKPRHPGPATSDQHGYKASS